MSKTKKLKPIKIVLETKYRKQVELTVEEAKELHDQLHTLFCKKTTYIPLTPIVIERDRWCPPYPLVWYSASTQGNHKVTVAQCSVSGNNGLTISYYGDAL